MSGIFNPRSAQARPLSGSVLPRYTPITRGSRQSNSAGEYFTNGAVAGLGSSAAPGEIPWQCWGIQAFQDCHAQQFAAAAQDCQTNAAQYGMSVDDCTNAYSAANDAAVCVPKNCAQYAAIAQQTGTLASATVKQAQAALNADLSRNGYKTIAADGKLGPATCGAAFYLYSTNPRQSTVWTDYNLYAYCGTGQGTNPTLVGASAPLKTYVAPQANVVQGQQLAPAIVHQWGVADSDMPALQNQINAILSSNSMNPIPVTGVLDAKTCGAMKWIGDNTGNDLLTMNGGQNCQAYILPTKKAVAAPGSKPPPGAPPAPTPPGKHPVSTAALMMGGLAVIAAGGAYYYAKKKGMV
jgi:hypothetical protein